MDWSLLGIAPTKNKKEITAAYRERVKVTNPEDQPEAFMALRAAYEEALRLAAQPDAEGPVEQWLENLRQLYGNFPLRQQPEAWKALLSQPVCAQTDTREAVRLGLLEFLKEHYYLSKPVWQVLEDTYHFRDHREELCETLPGAFVDGVILGWPEHDFGLPAQLFRPGIDAEACDHYTRQYYDAFEMSFNDLGDVLDKLEALPEQHPYGEILRYNWLKDMGEDAKALAGWEKLAVEYPDNPHLVMPWGYACLERGDGEQAEQIARHILDLFPNNCPATELLAEVKAASGDIKGAKEMLYELRRTAAGDPVVFQRILDTMMRWNESHMRDLEARLETNPEDGECRLELCWCLIQNQRLPEAETMAKELPADSVHPFEYYNLMGKLMCGMQRFEESLVFLQQAEQILRSLTPDEDPETAKRLRRLPEILQLQGGCLMELGRLEASREKLEAGLSMEPENSELLVYMGRVYHACGDHESCIHTMEKAARMNPGSWLAHYCRALSLYQLGRDGEAFQAVNDALDVFNRDLSVHVLKLQILLRNHAYDAVREGLSYLKERGAPENASVLFMKAQLLEEDEEDLPGALKAYRQVQELVEDGELFHWHGLLYYNIARLCGEIENPKSEALLSLLDKGLAEEPASRECLDYKAWLLKQDGKLQEALDLYLAQLEKPYHLPFVERGLARVYYEDLEQWADKSLACYEKLLEKQQNPELYFYAATCKRHMGDFAGAREYFLRELELDPQDVDGWKGLAHVCNALGDFEGALPYLEKAREAMAAGDHFYDFLFEQTAMTLRRLGRFEEAAKILEEALARYRWPEGWQLLMELHFQSGNWDAARETLRKWRRANPLDVEASLSEAQMYLLRNNMFRAVVSAGVAKRRMNRSQETDFRIKLAEMESNHRQLIRLWSRKAVKDPDDELAYVNLALAYWHGGDMDGCRAAAQKALRILDRIVKGYSVYRPLCLTRRAIVLGLLGRAEEARQDLALARSLPLCENCPYGSCKDADIYEAILTEISGDREGALEQFCRGRELWPDDLDFVSGIRRLERKGRKSC